MPEKDEPQRRVDPHKREHDRPKEDTDTTKPAHPKEPTKPAPQRNPAPESPTTEDG